MDLWLNCLREAEKTCLIEDGKKKVLFKFKNGQEMAEEYNLDTHVVTRRAWKVSKHFGGEQEWDVEVGDPAIAPLGTLEKVGIQEINTSPILSKRITKVSIEWRIRNLPYPVDTYIIDVDETERVIKVSTTNKKFFKKIPVPDLERLNLPIEKSRISISHKFNTLIISYKKPIEMTTFEKLLWEDINHLEATKEGPPLQCPVT